MLCCHFVGISLSCVSKDEETNFVHLLSLCQGIAQCTEIYNQLLGRCGKRQVPGAKIGLQHNLGLGGAVVVAIYKRGFPPKRYVAVYRSC